MMNEMMTDSEKHQILRAKCLEELNYKQAGMLMQREHEINMLKKRIAELEKAR